MLLKLKRGQIFSTFGFIFSIKAMFLVKHPSLSCTTSFYIFLLDLFILYLFWNPWNFLLPSLLHDISGQTLATYPIFHASFYIFINLFSLFPLLYSLFSLFLFLFFSFVGQEPIKVFNFLHLFISFSLAVIWMSYLGGAASVHGEWLQRCYGITREVPAVFMSIQESIYANIGPGVAILQLL